VSDLFDQIGATHRDVSRRTDGDTEVIVVALGRRYDAGIDDVWDAVTDPDRLARWLLPVSGELRIGGNFQLEGNVGGEVRECERPSSLTVTWGAPVSLVRVHLSADGDATELRLEHSVPVEFAGSGAGGLYVGPGWDVSVLALALFLAGEVVEDPAGWEGTLEVQRFSERTIAAWAEVILAGGTATAEEVAGATEAARAQFTPDLPAG
jgi:uncharacterized protein YndB with AHSA1/START domain